MKTELEDILKNDWKPLDREVPPKGHEERFAARLDAAAAAKARNRHAPVGDPTRKNAMYPCPRLSLRRALTAATAFAAVLFVMVYYYMETPNSRPDEASEVAAFYTAQLRQQAEELLAILTQDSGGTSELENEIISLTDLDINADGEFQSMGEEQKLEYLYRKYSAYSESLDYLAGIVTRLPKYTAHMPTNKTF